MKFHGSHLSKFSQSEKVLVFSECIANRTGYRQRNVSNESSQTIYWDKSTHSTGGLTLDLRAVQPWQLD
jgi:hypothetical protein